MTSEDSEQRNRPQPGAEFDAFASDYSGGMDNSVKALLGESGDDFLTVKLNWLTRRFWRGDDKVGPATILDYGCGRGDLIRVMAQSGIKARFVGSDVSGGMMQQGLKNWPRDLPRPTFLQQTGAAVPHDSASFDLVVISSVLHHVPMAERPDVYAEIQRLLKPGGQVVVFEHNPLNPVTRYVVSHTPIDEHAILLNAREVKRGLAAAGFNLVDAGYLMFAPPRLRRIGAWFDVMLGWLPLGAQYAVRAVKS